MALALMLATLLVAGAEDSVHNGIAAFDRGEFTTARDSLLIALAGAPLDPASDAAARTYLAATLFELGDLNSATLQLRELFRRHPDATVDPRFFVPPFVELAERERAAAPKDVAPNPAPDAPVREPAVVLTPAPLEPSTEPTEVHSNGPLYLRGGAVLAGVAAVVLAGLAYGNISALRGEPCADAGGARCADFSWQQAQSKSATANGELVGAGVSLGVAIALAAGSVVLFDEEAR